ncbi:MAG TPA: DUF1223 domain-containing protein [Bryobacteraceae bacterium]|nr:DUF1223 domain-containing protein [Bryobacteraceae bacterium]
MRCLHSGILMVGFWPGLLATAGFGQSRAPVIVELFTSEGCSSCPPADRLLEKLDPQAIVLSEHVDYWNQLGWKDPYSSAAFTARQQAYGRIFSLDSVYTPEMVVDGEAEFNGSDGRRAADAIAKAVRKKKADIRVSRVDEGVKIEVDGPTATADLYLALADESDESQVSAGENSGRHLHHVAVVRSLQKVGSVKRGASFSRVLELPRTAGAQRIVVFLQESGPGRISGAALVPPGKQSSNSD